MQWLKIFLIGILTGGLVGGYFGWQLHKPPEESKPDTAFVQLPPETLVVKVPVVKVQTDTCYVIHTQTEVETVMVENQITSVAELDTTIKDFAHLNVKYYIEPSLFDLRISDRVILERTQTISEYPKTGITIGLFGGTDWGVMVGLQKRRWGFYGLAGSHIASLGIGYTFQVQ